MTVPPTQDVHLPVDLIARGPHEAQRRAERALRSTPDAATRATALRVMGLARRELGDTESARALLRHSAAVAERAGLAEAAAHARASHQGLRALRGEVGVTGAALDRMASASGSAATLTLVHRGVAAAQWGRFESAVASFDAARDRLPPRSDHRVLAGLLSNRGLALLYTGRLSESESDLRRALALAEDHSLDYLRGITQQNLGCLAVRNGDVAQALSRFTTASALVPQSRTAALSLDHAEALLSAGMTREAAVLLGPDQVLGSTSDEAIARLLKAKVHLRAGRRAAALGQIRRVRSGFSPDSLWARLARRVERAAASAPDDPRTHVSARQVTTAPGVRAGSVGEPAAAPRPTRSAGTTTEVAPVTGTRTRSPAAVGAERVLAHSVTTAPLGPPALADPDRRHHAALRALAGRDHRGAHRALGRAPSRPTPPATPHLELQAHSRAPEREIAGVGAETALNEGDAATALHWIEYGRVLDPALARCTEPTWTDTLRRCRDAHVRASSGDDDALDDLRWLASRLSGAQWHGACSPPGASVPAQPPSLAELADALGERAFVCFARTPRGAVAITVVDGEVRAHPLAPPATIADATAKLLHAARVAAFAPTPHTSRNGVARPAACVERLLVTPVAAAIGARPLVIAPAPYAQDLPWGMLPRLAGRPLTVVPSGRVWLGCQQRARSANTDAQRVLLTAGPGLPGAVAEVRALRRGYPACTVLAGERARVGEVLEGLGRSRVAHLSAHGSVLAGTPMLSGLTLADGPLFAYDLERLPRAPELTVLSSCWGGRSQAAPGGFPLGLVTALLAAGGATVVAGVLPVGDTATAPAMAGFHDALARGTPPDRATSIHLADAGFVCFGAG